MAKHDNSFDASKHSLVQIASIGNSRLYRVDPEGCWEGDFYFKTDQGEGFIDTMYGRSDETELVVGFINEHQ